jgi:hypothetical protein
MSHGFDALRLAMYEDSTVTEMIGPGQTLSYGGGYCYAFWSGDAKADVAAQGSPVP